MSLAHGRDHLAIPGPSVIPDRVLRAMHRAAPNIYEGELVALSDAVFRDLERIAGNDGGVAMYLGNGHAAWEAALCNLFDRGDRVLAVCAGRFGHGWADMAERLGIAVTRLEAPPFEPVSAERIAAALDDDREHRIRAVLTVQTDTSSSVRQDIAGVREALDATGHPALLCVDAIASFACEPMRMSAMGVDLLVAASQKGLMTPPGVALVFVRDHLRARREKAGLVTPYWDWAPRMRPELFYEHFCGTAPTHHLYGLREALDMLLDEGIEAVWTRHEALARTIWKTVDAWAASGEPRLAVASEAARSRAVTTIVTAEGDAPRLRRWCESATGVTLGLGLPLGSGPLRSDALFRIGHMGHLNPPMLLGTLGCVDAGLKALGIAHGQGALEAATRTVADASVGQGSSTA